MYFAAAKITKKPASLPAPPTSPSSPAFDSIRKLTNQFLPTFLHAQFPVAMAHTSATIFFEMRIGAGGRLLILILIPVLK
jgi:hypothetical protein